MVTTQPQSIHRHTQQPHAGAQEISLVSCFVSVRLRARTPSGGSGAREQLRPCAPCPANSCGSGLGSANPRRPQGLRPFLTVGPTALPCAGGHPPQRPPPKPVTSRRQRVCDIAAHPPPAPHLSPATDHYPLSTIHYPLSTIHYPLSTDHRPLQFHRSSRYQPCGFSSLSPPPKRASPDPRT